MGRAIGTMRYDTKLGLAIAVSVQFGAYVTAAAFQQSTTCQSAIHTKHTVPQVQSYRY